MIYDNINNIGKLSAYPEIIRRASQFSKENDFTKLELGKYEIEGKGFFVKFLMQNADIFSNKKPEVHNKYLDLQFALVEKRYLALQLILETTRLVKIYLKIRMSSFIKM